MVIMEIGFTTADGRFMVGNIVKQYVSFEGGMRYLVKCFDTGDLFRCVKDEQGNFIQFVA